MVSPQKNKTIFDFHAGIHIHIALLFLTTMRVSIYLYPLLFISHMFVTLRNSAERSRQTSLCPKSFVLCVSFSRMKIKVVWEKVKKMKSIWYEAVPQCVRIHTHKERERDIHIYFWVLLLFPSGLPFAGGPCSISWQKLSVRYNEPISKSSLKTFQQKIAKNC